MIRKILSISGVIAVVAATWTLRANTEDIRKGASPAVSGPTNPLTAGAAPESYQTPLGLVVDARGKTAYVALHTAEAVAVVDLESGKIIRTIAVDAGPADVALIRNQLYIACKKADSIVSLDSRTNNITGRWPVDASPTGVAGLPDGSKIFIACHDAQNITVIDPANGATTKLKLPARPIRLKLKGDTQRLVALSQSPGNGIIHEFETRVPYRMVGKHHLKNVSNARGLAANGSQLIVAHQNPRSHIPATQVAQGWVFTNTVTLLSGKKPESFHVLDEPQNGFADPSDVVLSSDGRMAFVACAGADMVLVLHLDKMDGSRYGYSSKDDLTRSRQFVVAKIPTGANPRRMALSGDERILVTSDSLGDSLTVIDTRKLAVVKTIALGDREPDAQRRGEIAFHSNKMTFQAQFTCASCHPNGGGGDGLNWDLSRDGVGSFMNTRALLGSNDTAPYGWLGTSPSFNDRITGTLRTLHRHEPDGTEIGDLTAYLKSLKPARPLPQGKKESVLVKKGRLLFQGKARCATCHQGETLQDGLTHNIGSKIDGDLHSRFDTPSLRGVVRTAPYLHHGKAATLEDVFTRFNQEQRHGRADALTPAEFGQLMVYLRSL